MDGHQKRRKAIEKRIIDTAIELFRVSGFQKISMEEIAEKAQVSKVTLYKYFTNKPTLIRMGIMRTFQTMADQIQEHLSSDVSFHEKLNLLMSSKMDLVQNFSGEMMKELFELDPEFTNELMAVRRKAIMETSLPLLEEGRGKGHISPLISNEAFLVFFDVVGVGMVNSPAFEAFSEKNPSAFEEIQKIAMSCLQ